MKKVLTILGVVALIGGVLLIVVLVKAADVFHEAEGRAIYSSIGAWTRIQEFAEVSGKTDYIAEADSKMAFLQEQLSAWRQSRDSQDISRFEKMQATAYKTTDKNIKSGLNPLMYLDAPDKSPDPTADGAGSSATRSTP